MSVYKKEILKIVRQKGLIVLFVLSVINIYINTRDKEREFSESRYDFYAELWEGVYDNEICKKIESRNNEITELLSGEIGADEIIKNKEQISLAQLDQKVLTVYMQKLNGYKKSEQHNPYIFKDLHISEFMNSISIDILSLGTIMFILMSYWAEDKRNGLREMIATSVMGGNKITKYKIIVSACTAFFISALFSFSSIVVYIIKYGYEGMNYPIQSLLGFSDVEYSFNIIEAYLCVAFIKAIWSVVFGLLCAFLVACISSGVLAGITLLSYILIGIALKDFIGNAKYLFCGTQIDGVTALVSNQVLFSIIFAIIWAVIILFCIFLFIPVWNTRYSKTDV